MGNKEIIQKTILDLLTIMGFKGEIKIDDNDANNIIVNINSDQANFLIGQNGINLDSLQHLARILINKKTKMPLHFILDVNNYRKNRISLLEQMAKDIAERSAKEQIAVTLQPMPAYERRIIHLALSNQNNITTESIGGKEERRIIVKPTPLEKK